MISEPGRYKISFDEYLADTCPSPSLSRSVIMDLIDCPAKAFWNHPRLNPEGVKQEEAAHFDIGEAAHSLLLEGINVAEVIDAPDWKKKEAREAREAARLLGKVPLLKAQSVKKIGKKFGNPSLSSMSVEEANKMVEKWPEVVRKFNLWIDKQNQKAA